MPSLREQTQRHCAFCDGYPIEGISNETIEHFQPKALFPSFAYTWTNLYYCCDACQTAKGTKWDASLIRPDEADYTFGHYFEFDFTTGEMRPNVLASEADQQRAATTIRMYGLDSPARRRNREEELRKASKNPVDIDVRPYRDFLGA